MLKEVVSILEVVIDLVVVGMLEVVIDSVVVGMLEVVIDLVIGAAKVGNEVIESFDNVEEADEKLLGFAFLLKLNPKAEVAGKSEEEEEEEEEMLGK